MTTTTLTSPIDRLIFDALAAKVACTAAELGLADELAGGPRGPAELAAAAGAHEPSLRRLLRVMAGMGLVAEEDAYRFRLTALGDSLRPDAPDARHALLTMLLGHESWRALGELTKAVRTGERAFDRANGAPVFEYFARNPAAAETFNRAMAEHTRDAAPGLIAAADLGRFGTMMDVGGGGGTLMAAILREHPDLRGIVFDVPPGLPAAEATLRAAGVADRASVVAGDAFVAVPGGADAYLLKQILHDWDDAMAGRILRSCRAAMAPDARLLVLERLLPERVGPEDRDTLLVDLLMLLVPGGRERTGREMRALLAGAGLATVRVGEAIAPFGYHVIEAAPA